MNRRVFLKRSMLVAGATVAYPGISLEAESSKSSRTEKWRAAIIGHTGAGNYGHELDVIFNHRADVEVVAVADPVASGRERAAQRSRALRQYSDYHEMLDQERPQLLCIAPRWTQEHFDMALTGLNYGAHIFIEKPFTQTLDQADELLAMATKLKLKIAVAHQMRLAPNILHLKEALVSTIGELLEMRAWGKQDQRAGGEDMLVLGTHLFDLMRFFAGDALWCNARVLQNGHDVTLADVHPATEKIGFIAGDDVHAQFAFANGIIGSFTSCARQRESVGHWGIELIGSKSTARILADISPRVLLLKSGKWTDTGRTDTWHEPEAFKLPEADRGFTPANRRVVDDWLEAIDKDRAPTCSGLAGMKAVEMVMAVYASALSGERAPLPLHQRTHPLGN